MHPPAQPLHLGEKNAIDITLKGPPVQCLTIFEDSERTDDDGEGCARVQHRQDGSAYVEVVPETVGETEIGFMIAFTDRSVESAVIHANVIATHPPVKLEVAMMLDGRSKEFLIVGEQKRFEVRADFAGLKLPLYVPTKEVQFRITQPKKPVIHFDPATGMFVAERIGDALVESSYAGTKQTTCVMVREHEGFTPGNCEELREGGDGILPPGQDSDAPGADWHSRLPYTAGKMYMGRFAQDQRMGRFLADERLEIVPPDHALKIAESNPITLKVRGANVARVECNHNCVPVPEMKHRPTVDFKVQSNGSIVVSVFPWETGSLHYDFAVFFADGGVAHKTLITDVVFGTKQPRGINLSCGSDSYPDPNLPVILSVGRSNDPRYSPAGSWIDACYEGIRSAVLVPPNLITYRILGESKEPVMAVDTATGKLTALRPGTALLQREFQGMKTQTCLVVVAAPDEPRGHAQADCTALRTQYGLPPELPRMINPHY